METQVARAFRFLQKNNDYRWTGTEKTFGLIYKIYDVFVELRSNNIVLSIFFFLQTDINVYCNKLLKPIIEISGKRLKCTH